MRPVWGNRPGPSRNQPARGGGTAQPIRRLPLVVVAVTLAAIALFAFVSWHNYVRARSLQIEDMQGDADRALVAVDDRVTRLIDYADSYLRTLRAYYVEHGIDDPSRLLAFREFIEKTRFDDPLTFMGDVVVADADGHPSFVLSQPTPVRTDLSDLPYFKALQADQRDQMIVDSTRFGRVIHEYRFRVIRPIRIGGDFRGVIVMTLRPEAVTDLFTQFGLGPNSTISVMQAEEHRLIARVPVGNRGYFGRTYDNYDLWDQLKEAPRGTFHRESPLDHQSRHYTYLKSPNAPLVSLVGFADIDIDAELAETRRDIELQALAFALAAAAICGLVLRIIGIENRLRLSNANLEHAQRIGRIGSVEVDLTTMKPYWSDELYDIYERDRALGPATLEEFLAYVHPDDRNTVAEMREQHVSGEVRGPNEYRIVLRNGEIRWIHREVEVVRDSAGKPLKLIAAEQDITDRHRMQIELRREHDRLLFAQRMARMGSAEIDLGTGAIVRSDEFFRVVGADPGKPPPDAGQVSIVFHPDDREKVENAVRRMMAGEPVPSMELRTLGADGEIRWVRRDQEIIPADNGKPGRAVVTLLDITDQKRLEIQKDEFASTLLQLANHDALTGLPVLRLARDRLQMSCNMAIRDHSQVAVLFIDLDRFKAANDRFGHAAGDHVLKTVGARLIATIRSGDTAARQGGDEFLVILGGVGAEAAQQVAAKLVDAIQKPIPFGRETINVGASIGIALFPDHASTVDGLLALADRAMYAVKKSGKNGYSLYTAEV